MSTMSEQLEQRVAILEAEVARLKSKLDVVSSPTIPWWERIAGTFAENSAYDEAMQLGREYRESLRSNSVEPHDVNCSDRCSESSYSIARNSSDFGQIVGLHTEDWT